MNSPPSTLMMSPLMKSVPSPESARIAQRRYERSHDDDQDGRHRERDCLQHSVPRHLAAVLRHESILTSRALERGPGAAGQRPIVPTLAARLEIAG